MSANRASSAIAKETGYGYHEVRIGINRLVNGAGYSRFNAEMSVREAALAGYDIEFTVDELIRIANEARGE
jgi:hypothetical protein